MKMNYVLIDYENVQPERLSVFDAEHFKVLVFVGANQTKLSFEAAAALQKMGSKAEYIKISGQGSNALDFHVAFYIGHIAAQEPTAHFHIISKDAGFDPLVQHLKSRKLLVARYQDVGEIPNLKAANVQASQAKQASPPKKTASQAKQASPPKKTTSQAKQASPPKKTTSQAGKVSQDRIALIISRLQNQGIAKPRKRKTLLSSIRSIFQKQITEAELACLVRELQAKSYLQVGDTRVTYTLPAIDG
jgi:hypothetical protein